MAQRSGACENCSSKKDCHSGSGADNTSMIEADDPVGVKAGDRVIFTVSAGSVVKAGLLLYLMPIAAFIAGVVLGQTVLTGLLPGYNQDLLAGVTGAVFLAVAFIALKVYSAIAERKGYLKPTILRVE